MCWGRWWEGRLLPPSSCPVGVPARCRASPDRSSFSLRLDPARSRIEICGSLVVVGDKTTWGGGRRATGGPAPSGSSDRPTGASDCLPGRLFGGKSGVRGRPNPCGGGRESCCCLSSHAPAPLYQLTPLLHCYFKPRQVKNQFRAQGRGNKTGGRGLGIVSRVVKIFLRFIGSAKNKIGKGRGGKPI